MLDRLLELALTLGIDTGDAVRKDLAAIVQEALEYTDVAIIDVRDPAKLQRIYLLLGWIATIIPLTHSAAALKSLTSLAWTAA